MGTIPAPDIFHDAQQIAQAPENALAEFARVANLKQQTAASQVQMQGAQQENQIRAQQMKDQDALTKTLTQYDPTKHTLADIPKMVTTNGGSGAAALQVQSGLVQQRKNLSSLSDEQFAQEQKKADLVAGVHDSVSKAPPEQKQALYSQGLQQLGAAGVDVSKEPPQYPGDEVFAQHLPAIRLHSAIVSEADKDRETTAKETEANTKALEAQTTQKRLQAELPGGALEAPDKKELREWLARPENKSKDSADFLAWKAKQNPTAMVLGNMLGQGGQGSALDQQAEKYFQSGQLPSGFARSPGTTAAIIKRTNELHPGESLAENQAGFKANQTSLTNLQKSFDTVSAFENTAGKNLELYLDKLKAIPDLGVKFANVPLRMIDEKLIGSDNYQAMKAAQQTAASEAAKVLSSANASGVLSDSQKKEAEDMLSGNLTFSAAQKVVATLKQDFANRHQSYAAQIADIKSRLGGKASSDTAGAAAAPANPQSGAFSWDAMPKHQ